VITAELARQVWPQQEAVGRSFYWGGIGGNPITVIGVVADVRDYELTEKAPPMLFLPTTQMAMPMMTLLVRAQGSTETLSRAIREAVWAMDPTVPVPTVRPVTESRAQALARPRLQAMLMTSFGTLALLVAALGVYALVSFQVASRRRELGIRCALGALPHALTGLLLRRTIVLVVLGLIAGCLLLAPLSGALRVLLFQTAPLDPRTFASVAAALMVAAFVAAYLPARRIARIDPLTALRND
jgi:ABC-type antimicrobial peptide transport system permease subunit